MFAIVQTTAGILFNVSVGNAKQTLIPVKCNFQLPSSAGMIPLCGISPRAVSFHGIEDCTHSNRLDTNLDLPIFSSLLVTTRNKIMKQSLTVESKKKTDSLCSAFFSVENFITVITLARFYKYYLYNRVTVLFFRICAELYLYSTVISSGVKLCHVCCSDV